MGPVSTAVVFASTQKSRHPSNERQRKEAASTVETQAKGIGLIYVPFVVDVDVGVE